MYPITASLRRAHRRLTFSSRISIVCNDQNKDAIDMVDVERRLSKVLCWELGVDGRAEEAELRITARLICAR